MIIRYCLLFEIPRCLWILFFDQFLTVCFLSFTYYSKLLTIFKCHVCQTSLRHCNAIEEDMCEGEQLACVISLISNPCFELNMMLIIDLVFIIFDLQPTTIMSKPSTVMTTAKSLHRLYIHDPTSLSNVCSMTMLLRCCMRRTRRMLECLREKKSMPCEPRTKAI